MLNFEDCCTDFRNLNPNAEKILHTNVELYIFNKENFRPENESCQFSRKNTYLLFNLVYEFQI